MKTLPKVRVESVGSVYGKTWRASCEGVSALGTTPSAALKGWAVEVNRQRRLKKLPEYAVK